MDPPASSKNTSSCPDVSYWDIFGYFIFGLFVAWFLWLLIFKLKGWQIVRLPAHMLGGTKIYSIDYLKIGE